jgi:nitroreductase
MGFQELIRKRYSVRAYKPDQVEDDKLDRVLEAALIAPTAANRQAFRIIVVRTADEKEGLRRIYGRDWFVQAPLVLCVCAVPSEAWVRKADGWNAAEVDATIVMTHIVLAAAAEGLGTCWIAAFDPAAAREVLGLPADLIPSAFTPLGFAADTAGPKKRRTLAELVRRGLRR